MIEVRFASLENFILHKGNISEHVNEGIAFDNLNS